MFSLFVTTPVHLKIYPDRLELTNIKTGETHSGTPAEPFSTSRILLSRFGPAETLGRQLVKDLKLRHRRMKMLVQPMRIADDGLAEIEKRAMRDLAEQMGARQVYIITEEVLLTMEEILKILSEG